MSKTPKKVALVLFLLAVAALTSYYYIQRQKAGDRSRIRLSGTIEATITRVSFKIPGRLAQRLVSEGDSVTNGQPVALLDPDELTREAAMRYADRQAAAATLADLEAGARSNELRQAEAALDVTRAEAARALSDFTRQKELFQQRVVSSRDYESAEAIARVAAARATEAEARLTLLREGARPDAIQAARSRLDHSREAAQLADIRLGYASLASPLDGIVLAKGAENGEYVLPGMPIVTIADLRHVWLRVYLDEADLGHIRIGQPVSVTTDAFPGKSYAGVIAFLSPAAEFTPKTVQTQKERVKLVYRLKVTLDNPDQELKPGMPADARIELR